MIVLASDWLLLAVVLCCFAWMAGKRWTAISLPLAVALAAISIYIPTGSPRLTQPPPGNYQVLGADIQANVAIYVLLKSANGVAVYYKLPYSTTQANALQNAMDGEGGVTANVGQDGGVAYDGDPPVTGDDTKAPEQPAISLP